MMKRAATGQSRQGGSWWENQVLGMTEEKEQGKRNRVEEEGKRGRDMGKEGGRNAPVCWVNPGNLMQG